MYVTFSLNHPANYTFDCKKFKMKQIFKNSIVVFLMDFVEPPTYSTMTNFL